MKNVKNHEDGFFKPESMIRRISQEGVVLLGGGHAILLQLAHPFISAGVDDYSNFQSEILTRLYHTISFMHSLVFEGRKKAHKSIEHFHAVHNNIKGYLWHRSGNYPPNTYYSGSDPQAKLWVHATFIHTSLKVYEKFIKPLTPEERINYYSDSLKLAELLGIPSYIVPESPDEFQRYMKSMLSGNELTVTSTTRYLANSVLYPKVGFLPSISAKLLRLVTAGLLPERFRLEYGLKWDWKRQYLLKALIHFVSFFRPIAPSWIWKSPFQGGKLIRFILWKSLKLK